MGEFAAFEVILRELEKVPVAVGLNLNTRVHVPAGGMLRPLVQVVVACLVKGTAGLPTVVRVRFALPVFVIVTLLLRKLPVATDPKLSGFGEAFIMAPFEEPVIFTAKLAFVESFDGMLKEVGKVPLMVGVNVIVIEHVWLCARVFPEQKSAVLL